MKAILMLICAAALCFSNASCKSSVFRTAPPIPVLVQDAGPSWDEGERNSGLIDYVDGKGFLITPSAAKRYNGLIEYYKNDYSPALEQGKGLSEDSESKNFYLNEEGMVLFQSLNIKKKSGIAPQE